VRQSRSRRSCGPQHRRADCKSATASRLFSGRYKESARQWPTWDVLPEGRGFLLIQDFAQPRTTRAMVQAERKDDEGRRVYALLKVAADRLGGAR
jgi:hypothetical protein